MRILRVSREQVTGLQVGSVTRFLKEIAHLQDRRLKGTPLRSSIGDSSSGSFRTGEESRSSTWNEHRTVRPQAPLRIAPREKAYHAGFSMDRPNFCELFDLKRMFVCSPRNETSDFDDNGSATCRNLDRSLSCRGARLHEATRLVAKSASPWETFNVSFQSIAHTGGMWQPESALTSAVETIVI